MRSRRLTRSLSDRTLGGVCGGLGAYIGVNPWWVRGTFVILGLWFILPPETLADIPRDLSDRRATSPETMILIGCAVIVMGLIVLARNLGVLSGENGDAFLPLVIIVFGLTLLVKQLWRAA
jgi:phage shock protein PspC (stress-responsive transcriptional regulator)